MGRWTKEFQRNDMHEWDLTVTCERFDFGSEMFLLLIALLMYVLCQLSINNPIEAIYFAGKRRIRFSCQVITRVVICIN